MQFFIRENEQLQLGAQSAQQRSKDVELQLLRLNQLLQQQEMDLKSREQALVVEEKKNSLLAKDLADLRQRIGSEAEEQKQAVFQLQQKIQRLESENEDLN